MKSHQKILVAFLLNLFFSVFELIGGVFTGSVAILSDAIHDFGDAASIGLSYLLERKSRHHPDEVYTYGYTRFSVLGSFITTTILLLGSILVICNAIGRILNPVSIHYSGMIVFAVLGLIVNFCGAWFTREDDSLNQKAVNLHMLEDVLGWAVVLAGAIIMQFVNIPILDPFLSIGVALFILFHAAKNLKDILNLFLEKCPNNPDFNRLKETVCAIDGVVDVHHIHLRSLDGQNLDATMHIVTDKDAHYMRDLVRQALHKLGINHTTLEMETPEDHCHNRYCSITHSTLHHHHHG